MTELTLPDEILVVDDGGEDGCDNTVSQFADRLPIRYLYTHNPGLAMCSHARNVGIKNTDADLVITSEPEMYFLTDVVKQLIEGYPVNHNVVSAGTIYHAQQPDTLDTAQCKLIEGWTAPYVGLYPRQALLDIGGWDENFPYPWGFDDIDLLTRLRVAKHINQDIDKSIKALHQWHRNPGRDEIGALKNDPYFYSKDYENDPSILVANQGQEWGVAKCR